MKPEDAGLAPGKRRLLIGVVAALAAALGLALLVVAFLFGRLSAQVQETARPAAEVSRPEPSAVTTAPGNSIMAPEDVRGPSARAFVEPVPTLETADGMAPTADPPNATSSATISPQRARVAAYFQEIDRLEDMGAGDPEAFAKSLMESMTSGDFSGFDSLLAKARAHRDRLRTIAPPLPCGEHHRLALALASDSVTLMEKLKAGLLKGDATALMAMATEGRALETRADELRSLSGAIRRQVGL